MGPTSEQNCSHEVKSRTRGRALLSGQDRHPVVGCVARQSKGPQPCGLFANGMPICFAFGHCILALPQRLFLFLEKRFGPIKFRGKPAERMFLLTGCLHAKWISAGLPAEQVRTSPGHGQGLGCARPRHRGPTLGRDEGGLIPRNHFFQLDQLRGRIRLALELVDADRRECRHDGSGGTVVGHLACGACEHPSAPVKTDRHRRDGTEDCPLQKTGQ
jgi:hypothetical protein